MQASVPPSRQMEMCGRGVSSPGRCSSSGNGLRSGTMRSWRTGNGHGGMSPCSASTRWRNMKIMDESYLPAVVGVAVVGDRVLRLLFSDGTAGDVDFSGEWWTGVLSPLNDPAYFAEVTVDPEAWDDRLAWRHRPGARTAVRASESPSAPRRLTAWPGRSWREDRVIRSVSLSFALRGEVAFAGQAAAVGNQVCPWPRGRRVRVCPGRACRGGRMLGTGSPRTS